MQPESIEIVEHPTRLRSVAVGTKTGIIVGAVVAQRRTAVGAGPESAGIHHPVTIPAFAHWHGNPPP